MNGILDRREFAIGGAALFAGLLASGNGDAHGRTWRQTCK